MKVVYFNLLVVFLFVVSCKFSFAQITYTSNDNFTGNWEAVSTWSSVGGWSSAPQSPGNPTNSNANGINIYGYIRVNSTLNVNNANPVINVYDTLWVDGDMNVGSGAQINIYGQGVLVVTGNYTSSGGFRTNNDGRAVVLGDVNINSGTTVSTDDEFYIFGDLNNNNGYVGDRDGNSCYTWGGCDPTQYTSTESDLYNNDRQLYEFATNGGVLPVEVENFQAVVENGAVFISWATLTELNFDYFSIERSIDGQIFEEIGTVAGNGNTTTRIEYQWADYSPEAGVAYYRLKATDYDGFTEYHGVIRVEYESASLNYNVYPNPIVDNKVYIESTQGLQNVSLININGQHVTVDYNQVGATTEVNVGRDVAPGYYYLQMTFDVEVKVEKVYVR